MSDYKKPLTGFIASVVLTLVLVYLSMEGSVLPYPDFLRSNQILLYILQTVLSLCVMFINIQVFVSGFSSLIHRSPNMDTLISLGTVAAFLYSAVVSLINII